MNPATLNGHTILAETTRCRICNQIFQPPVPIIGESPEKTHADFLMKLGKHFGSKHQDVAAYCVQMGASFSDWLMLCQFESGNPRLRADTDQRRWTYNQMSKPAHIPDDKLKLKCSELARELAELSPIESVEMERVLETQFEAVITPVFTAMRDLYEEPGKYALQQQPTT